MTAKPCRRSFLRILMLGTALAGMSGTRGYAAAPRRPNIITIILDDVGYSDLGCFGSEIRTPHIDALAQRGLRYNRFDTKALCSPTRASLLTGRNNHTVNFPNVPDAAPTGAYAADAFQLPKNAETVAQALQRVGYATWNVGKWHLAPLAEMRKDGPRESWPLQHGFDYFYGFPRGWTDQYRPELVENNGHINPQLPGDYHLSRDLVDKSISLIDRHMTGAPDAPFYLNLAFGAAHAPIQVPAEYANRYDAIYSRGWDWVRETRLARMKRMGVVPKDTILPSRNPGDRAWSELTEDEKVVFARYMAVYAGFLEHADEQVGRLLQHLAAKGLEKDTIIVLISDNGAAGEAGPKGDFEHLYAPNRLTPAQQRTRLSELGTGKTQAEYPRPWAMAGVTPLRRYKVWPFSGGTRTPMIFAWPGVVKDPGAIRSQFVDVIDIAPTLLEAAGTRFATSINGVAQIPVAGRSIMHSLRSSRAPAARRTQYVEVNSGRAITDGTWRAVATHECGKGYEEDRWELFNLETDFSENFDLSQKYPGKLREMKALWQREWDRYNSGPLQLPNARQCFVAKMQD